MPQVTGFVALLDVLGFSSLVTGPNSENELSQYLEAVNEAVDGKAGAPVEFVLFSDSIVINTRTDDERDLRTLLRACSRTIGLLLEREIAVRGAIAHGSFLRDNTPNGAFVAGRPIVEAYEFEKRQNWTGVMLAPSVLKVQPEIPSLCRMPERSQVPPAYAARLPWFMLVQHNERIPFHSAGATTNYEGFAVVPTSRGAETLAHSAYLQRCIAALGTLKSLAPDPQAQLKHAAAIEWLKSIHTRWDQIATGPHGTFPARVEYY